MKKIIFLCLVFIIICPILFTGCVNNTSKDANNIQDIKTEFYANNEKIELEEINILSNKIHILMPKSFSIMSEEMSIIKYPSENRPTLIYTNESGSINITLNHTKNLATKDQIPEYVDYFKEIYENQYPSIKWYNSTVEEINGKSIGVLELLSPAIDTSIYNLICLTDLDGRLLLLAFNCTQEELDDWKPIAKTIMQSQIYE